MIIVEITVGKNPTCSTQVSSTLMEECFLVLELNWHESQVPSERGSFDSEWAASQILTVGNKSYEIIF